MAKESPGRLRELDCLRGMAAFAVLIAHYSYFIRVRYNLDIGPVLSRWQGEYAVSFFFVISGFVIFMTLEKTRRPLDFVVSRFSRLFPSYWVGVIFTFSVVSLLGLPPPWYPDIHVGHAALNLTMLHPWFFVDSVDGVYWTLIAELSFYFWMFLAFSATLLARIRLLGCIGLAVWLANAILEHYQAWPFPGGKLPEVWRLSFLLQFGPLFLAGILYYLIWSGKGSARDHLLIALCLAVFEGMLFLQWRGEGWLEFVVPPAIFGFFYLFIRNMLGFLVIRPLIFLGWISYPLYLIHSEAGRAIIRHLSETWEIDVRAAVALATIAIVLISTAITMLVEQPAMRWIRDRYTAWKASAQPAPV
jgi:peptidoglycan/LPS O-acetylase OafA/YrhL